ncbi:MAG: P-II family nitrogen regulator [Deltaproteobacteria bacterium]|nr:P-II family nitrogen regulator [Deltaproteobacteria bacterium]
MKLIIAVIRPERLEAVQEELQKVLDEDDNYRITVDAVEGHGAQHGEVELFRGQAVRPRMIPKTRIMVGVNDKYVEPTVQAILRAARTESGGAVGDGKIFVTPLDECIRIRTGERGGGAI